MRNFEEIYNTSEVIKECNQLLAKINERFAWFTDQYKRFHKEEITELELKEIIEDRILELSDYELTELNEMHKMLSRSNCYWMLYKVGEMVHKAILKKWYPEDYK